jgi:hypothetical protein
MSYVELHIRHGLTGYSPAGSVVSRVQQKVLQDKNLERQIANTTDYVLKGDVRLK